MTKFKSVTIKYGAMCVPIIGHLIGLMIMHVWYAESWSILLKVQMNVVMEYVILTQNTLDRCPGFI